MKRLLAIGVGLFIASFASAQHKQHSYFLSATGDDRNNGSKDQPFQSIAKINTINLLGGDTVFFKGGDSFQGTLLIDGVAASRKNSLVITSFAKGLATINAKDSGAIIIRSSRQILVKKINCIGSGRKDGNVKDGLLVFHSHDIEIRDLDISGFQKGGLKIFSSSNIKVDNVFAHDNGAAGIMVEGPIQQRESSNIKILNCRAENNSGDPTKLDNHSGNGIVVGNCRNILIDHCTATNNGWDMPRIGNGPVGIWAYEADSVIIQYCLAYQNKTSKGGGDGGGFDLDGGVTNSVVQHCFSYGNEGSGYCIFQYWGASPWHDNVFRYNISENDGTVSDSQAGLYIWNSSSDEKQFYNCQVYGNIIYNSKVAAVSFSSTSQNRNFHFYNNIFVGKDSLINGSGRLDDVKLTGNDWWSIGSGFNIGGSRNFQSWSIQSGKERLNGKLAGWNENPNFESPGRASYRSFGELINMVNYDLPSNSTLIKKLHFDRIAWFGKRQIAH